MTGSLSCVVPSLAACGALAADRQESRTGASCPGAVRLGPSNATFVGSHLAFDRYTTRQGAELQSARERGGSRFSKLGLFLRGGERAELRVPKDAPRSVRLKGWPSHRPSRVIVVTDDPGSACWQGLPGGFLFKKPICLRLRVKTPTRRAVVPFGLGRDC
jgi:hypothetical protein